MDWSNQWPSSSVRQTPEFSLRAEGLSNVPSTPAAVAMLFGLTYVLNLNYLK